MAMTVAQIFLSTSTIKHENNWQSLTTAHLI
jgi:hypothetical protein